jgi:hypothetical protein
MDYDNIISSQMGSQAKVLDWQQRWLTRFFAPVADIEKRMLLAGLPPEMQARLADKNPVAMERVMSKLKEK